MSFIAENENNVSKNGGTCFGYSFKKDAKKPFDSGCL